MASRPTDGRDSASQIRCLSTSSGGVIKRARRASEASQLESRPRSKAKTQVALAALSARRYAELRIEALSLRAVGAAACEQRIRLGDVFLLERRNQLPGQGGLFRLENDDLLHGRLVAGRRLELLETGDSLLE